MSKANDTKAILINGLARTTVLNWITANEVRFEVVSKGTRKTYRVHEDDVRRKLDLELTVSYQSLYDQWVLEQETATLTGQPLSPRTIEANTRAMKKYWHYLGSEPAIDLISPKHLLQAFSNIPVNHESKNCGFTQRDHIFKALLSFYKLLIRLGVKNKDESEAIRECKPKRLYDPIKPSLKLSEFDKAIEANNSKMAFRNDFDRALTHILLITLTYTGIRRTEASNLKLEDVDLEHSTIQIAYGKGGKHRKIGILPKLKKELEIWINEYRPESEATHLFLGKTGNPVSPSVINNRLQTVSQKAGIHITPHALRRSHATAMSEKGVPLTFIRKTLGHSKIETTQGYLMTSEQDAVDYIKQFQGFDNDRNTGNASEDITQSKSPVTKKQKTKATKAALIEALFKSEF